MIAKSYQARHLLRAPRDSRQIPVVRGHFVKKLAGAPTTPTAVPLRRAVQSQMLSGTRPPAGVPADLPEEAAP